MFTPHHVSHVECVSRVRRQCQSSRVGSRLFLTGLVQPGMFYKHLSYVTFQSQDPKFGDGIHHPLGVACHVSCVNYHMLQKEKHVYSSLFFQASCRMVCQQKSPRTVISYFYKIYLSLIFDLHLKIPYSQFYPQLGILSVISLLQFQLSPFR